MPDCVAVGCSVFLSVVVWCRVLQCVVVLTCVVVTSAVCCSVLQRVAVCCCVLQCVVVCCCVLQCIVVRTCAVLTIAMGSKISWSLTMNVFFVCARGDRATEFQNGCDCVRLTRLEIKWLCEASHTYACCVCAAVCCSVLQCVAVCCSVLQWHVWRSNDCEKQATPIHVVFVLQCIAVCYSVLQCVAVTCLEVKWLWEASHTYACCLYGLDSVFVAEYLCPCVRERAREWACVCACIPLGEKERNHQWERQKERVRETIFFPRNCSFNHAFFNALWMGAGIWDQRIKHTHTPITRTKLGHDPIVQYWDMTPWILKRERILTQI